MRRVRRHAFHVDQHVQDATLGGADVEVGRLADDRGFGLEPGVQRPGLASALLQGLRAHADPAEDLVYLVIEDDAALAEMLTQAGATVRHEILHLDGLLKGEETEIAREG